MGQIVKRKKKGRPSKADLAQRPVSSPPATESEVRRSVRRRNVRYDIDYYEEYFDEEDEEEEEERRREKKLKLVVKLNQQRSDSTEPAGNGSRSSAREHASDEEDEEEEDDKPVKKRKINGSGDVSESEEEEDNYNDDEEERGRKVQQVNKGQDSVPGTPTDRQSGISLPDKKSLELILDKLQKKDTYGVYAEPVDPEELPDYHDVIEHPMDFATVRKKLTNGSYPTLEEFESDVFLICSNAMQYNAPDTIYHKQAHTIQELGKKKFHRLRAGIELAEKELKPENELKLEKEHKLEKDLKSEQKAKCNFLVKKQIKKPFSRSVQEPVGSDFLSGVTLATTGDIQNGSIAQAGACERPSNTEGLVDGNPAQVDSNLEKVEDLSVGKGLISKLGRKLSAVDENRRATYNLSNQPVVRSESIFTTFESEIKDLVPVGLHAEYSYARSLARFAATLGPVAWKVTSQRIEQALPSGYKFGRGWVGEYEPLPTPVLMLENRTQKESPLFPKLQSTADVRNDDIAFRTSVSAKVHPVNRPISEGNPPVLRPTANGPAPEGKTPLFATTGTKPSTPVNAVNQQHNPFSRTFTGPETKVSNLVELNLQPKTNQGRDLVAGKQISLKVETSSARSSEMVPRNMNLLQSLPSKQLTNNEVGNGGLPNGKVTNNCENARMISPSSDNAPNRMARATAFFPIGREQQQGLTDPVQLMKMFNETAQKQQNSSNQSQVSTQPVMPSAPSVRRDDPSNAAAAAAHAWMSIGAGGFKPVTENSSSPKNQVSSASFYNPTRDFHTQISGVREFPHTVGMRIQSEKSTFPPQGFGPQAVCAVNEAQFHNRPMVFPQLVTPDFHRFQMQSPWQGLSPHAQPRQRQEGLPPDLNIGFQSPRSPVKQSSGVLVDSQQPDLALQL